MNKELDFGFRIGMAAVTFATAVGMATNDVFASSQNKCLVEANAVIKRTSDGKLPVWEYNKEYGATQLATMVKSRLLSPGEVAIDLNQPDGCSPPPSTDMKFSGFYQTNSGNYRLIQDAVPELVIPQ